MALHTPLCQEHETLNAKMVEFAGFLMPMHYGSQIEEHHAVRRDCGMFDVSHMMVSEIKGSQVEAFLQYLLANDVAKLDDGKALYSGMLNEAGGVIDDLITYRINKDYFRIISNAGTRDKVTVWLAKQAGSFDVVVSQLDGMAIIAVQGPTAIGKVAHVLDHDIVAQIEVLKPFHFVLDGSTQIARTGYTGEDGVEIVLPASEAVALWEKLLQAGVKPVGLGARDTLRLEAGFNLYGQDMDESTSPLVSNMGWTVAMKDDRHFIGRAALETEKSHGISQKLVGLVLLDKGVLRAHQAVSIPDLGDGEVTSGTFSPTLGKSVALARVPKEAEGECVVQVRNKLLSTQIVKPSFVKHGEALV